MNAFADTNILIYATLEPDERSEAARAILTKKPFISVQVLNEFVNVARRKFGRSWAEIMQATEAIQTLCQEPLPLTIATHRLACKVARAKRYGLYDCLIIASAIESDCSVLFSEHFQHGQSLGHGLVIHNPFRPR